MLSTCVCGSWALSSRQAILSRIDKTGVVAVIRADGPDELVDVCRALAAGGVVASEITMTTPGALDAIAQASKALGDDCVLGVGSVLDPETARAAILAGAQYIVCPTTNIDVIEMAHRYGKPAMPGALTPTEIPTAWQAGADMVKVFPANHFGPRYIKDLLAPMPQLRLIPTGGVNIDNVGDWFAAGAACVGVGSAFVKKDLIAARDWPALTALAKQFVEAVAVVRNG